MAERACDGVNRQNVGDARLGVGKPTNQLSPETCACCSIRQVVGGWVIFPQKPERHQKLEP